MKISLQNHKDAYEAVSEALNEWCFKHSFQNLIVEINTTTLGRDIIVALYDGFAGFDFDTDWYEGGEVEILGITPLDEVDIKYRL